MRFWCLLDGVRVTDQYDHNEDGLYNSPSVNTYSDPDVGDRYTYDANGNVKTHTDSNNKVTSYTYDTNHHILTSTQPDGSVFTYDSTGKIVSEQYPNGVTNTTNYNSDGTKSGVTSGNNNYSAQYGYDTNGNVNQFTETFGSNVKSASYTYDSNGNILTISEGGVLKVIYAYVSNNQLTREDNVLLNKTIVYGYDSNGNMVTKTIYPYTTGTLGTAVTTYTYQYNSNNQLINDNGNAVTYNGDDNTQTLNGWTYTWQNSQVSGMTSTGCTISYQYNYNGIRTSKTVNGATTTYTLDDNNNITSQTNGTNTINYTYNASGSLVYMTLNGTIYYYEKNMQGDIVGLVDSNNNEVVSYAYDTWGKLLSIGGSLASTVGVENPFRYRSYYYDTETGLYRTYNSYYSPDLGQYNIPYDPNVKSVYSITIPHFEESGGGLSKIVSCLDSPQSPGTKGNPLKTVQIGTFPSTSIDAVSNFINISGWALASDGVKSVTITITPIANGSPQVVLSKTYTAVYGLGGRDDVIKANSGGYPNGAACGFEYGIDSRSLSNNTEYSISVTSESNDNKSTQTQSIDVYVQNSGSAMPPESNLDIPAKGASIMSGSITVAGWADDMSGVSSIAITMDKTYMGQATIGYDRYDVYEACPGYPNEPYIGYSYLIQSNRFGAGQTHTIYATYTFGNGKTKMDSVTINPPANTPPAGAATSATHQQDETNLTNRINNRYYGTKYYGTAQCFGFASLVFNDTFGIQMSGTDWPRYELLTTTGVKELGDVYPNGGNATAQQVQDLFSNARIGDWVQMVWHTTSTTHSAIFAGTDSTGFYLFQANYDDLESIAKIHYTWNDYAAAISGANHNSGDATGVIRDNGVTVYTTSVY